MTRLPRNAVCSLLFVTLAAPVAGASDLLHHRATLPRDSARPRFQQSTQADPTPKKSFFKTRRGILIVSLSAIAVSYTLWSKQHDRVHSPVR